MSKYALTIPAAGAIISSALAAVAVEAFGGDISETQGSASEQFAERILAYHAIPERISSEKKQRSAPTRPTIDIAADSHSGLVEGDQPPSAGSIDTASHRLFGPGAPGGTECL